MSTFTSRVISFVIPLVSVFVFAGDVIDSTPREVGSQSQYRNAVASGQPVVSHMLLTHSDAVAAQKPALELQPCEVGGVRNAKCGTLQVYEDRAKKAGRKIDIKILLVPATGSPRMPDPFVYIPGGPGSSAIEDGPYLLDSLAKIREHRDLLFVDQRGTGGSNPLNCVLFNPEVPQSYLGYFFPLESVRKCRTELEQKADLKLYTTPIAMDDLDDVRAALGYEKLNLFGASYGTRAAMVYLRQHPQHVRTVVLHGVSPPWHHMPGDFPQQTDRALHGVLAECAADPACNSAYPKLREESTAVLERLLKGPVEVEVSLQNPPFDGTRNEPKRAKVSLSRDLAAEAIRYLLYQVNGASQVPFILNRAAAGDFVPLAQSALRSRQTYVDGGSNGMYLSVTCAEDLPWIKPGVGEKLAVNTFLGDYRLRQQREACALWPRGEISSSYGAPVKSTASVLIVTGEWDPVTPPANGEETAKHLPNSLHLVVPHGAHGLSGLEGGECVERLKAEFIEKGAVKGLDVTCVKSIKRKGWLLPKRT